MYGMPGNRFGNAIRVQPADLSDLVKEAQVIGQPTRDFFVKGRKMTLAFDGMFVIDATSNEVVDESRLNSAEIYTALLS